MVELCPETWDDRQGMLVGNRIQPVSNQTFTRCMEQLQEGYVFSVAATAGCLVERVERDVYGLDVLFVRPRGPGLEEVSLYAQLKATSTLEPSPQRPSFGYQFKQRVHFDRLTAKRSTIKAVLLVMIAHPDQSRWSSGDHQSLSLRRCCYWANIEGQESSAQSPTVRIPTDQVFSASALTRLLDRVERGEPL